MSNRSFTFNHAINRAPGASVAQGLREADTGAPDLGLFQAHHAAYVAALRATGAAVTELPALDQFPDGVFVEDAALTLPEGTVILRPGAPSRLGEAAAMAPVLARFYGAVAAIEGPGYIEGGDILT
ncbi:MAG: dimethylarginine dimethylaminohydrolase, partial [Thermohalobaculum sp.]